MAPSSNSNSDRGRSTMSTVLLIIPYLVLIFVVWRQNEAMMGANLLNISQKQTFDPASILPGSSSAGAAAPNGLDFSNILRIPQGEGVALPSIRVEDSTVDNKRQNYGGAGDKAHLGGFTELDTDGISPNLWKNMVTQLGVRSVLDVGCGRGTSTTWFLYHGLRIKCAEGSHDAVMKTFLPDPATQVTEHDFSRGPWWPKDTFDAVWAVEFLEHVGVNFHFNYISAFRKAALLFVTSSRWGGWHHVEVHFDPWWIQKFESYGFRYSETLTQQARGWAQKENNTGPDGNRFRAQHLRLSLKVFVNPMVAALPEHAHLFPELGCYVKRGEDGNLVHRECGVGRAEGIESKLPESYKPLVLTPEMDQKWMDLLRNKLNTTKLASLV